MKQHECVQYNCDYVRCLLQDFNSLISVSVTGTAIIKYCRNPSKINIKISLLLSVLTCL